MELISTAQEAWEKLKLTDISQTLASSIKKHANVVKILKGCPTKYWACFMIKPVDVMIFLDLFNINILEITHVKFQVVMNKEFWMKFEF